MTPSKRLLQASAVVTLMIFAPQPLRAEEASAASYGLAWFLHRHQSGAGLVHAEIAAIRIGEEMAYVADFYGDGLIRFRVADATAAGLLKDNAPGMIDIDLKTIDATIGRAALGAVTMATSLKLENDAMVLEAAPAMAQAAAAPSALGSVQISKVKFFSRPWQQPMRVPNRKGRSRMQAQANTLKASAAGSIVPGSPGPGPQLGPGR